MRRFFPVLLIVLSLAAGFNPTVAAFDRPPQDNRVVQVGGKNPLFARGLGSAVESADQTTEQNVLVGSNQETTGAAQASSGGTGKLDADLVDLFATQASADFIVRFAEQADLSPAYEMGWGERGQFVVKTLEEVNQRTQARAKAFLRGQGLNFRTFIAGNELYVRGGNLTSANSLANLPEVSFIRATRTYTIPEPEAAPLATTAWGISYTHATDFWAAYGAQGEGIVVANIDTGVQWDHPALVNAFKCGSDPADPACWEDPSNICGAGGACDNNGHGTHTMGTMVADDDPALTYIAGMAPNAQWIACKGCETNECSDFALNSCADWILAPAGDPAKRPHIVNNSWGGPGGDVWYRAKVQAWRAAGIFPAFSAGNDGPSCGSHSSPGDYQESFSSAAHDSAGNIAIFSSRGPGAFGHNPYTKPNITAPGVNVCSTVPTDSWSCSFSGTSMASPHTAGAVALLWSCNPSLIGSIDQTFQILQDTSDAAAAGNCGAPPDGEGNYTYGYGYLNVLAAGAAVCAGTGVLEGNVTDATTTNPIANAQVEADGLTTAADGAGFYQFPNMPAGTYSVTASAAGYAPQTATGVTVTDGATTTQDFALSPSSATMPPVIDSFTAVPWAGLAPLDVTFTCVAHDPDPGGFIEEYRWDFGDSLTSITSANTTIHTYSAHIGPITTKVTVKDNSGATTVSSELKIFPLKQSMR